MEPDAGNRLDGILKRVTALSTSLQHHAADLTTTKAMICGLRNAPATSSNNERRNVQSIVGF